MSEQKKTPKGQPADAAGTTVSASGQTLAEILALVGAPSKVAVRAAFRGADEAAMLARGQEIATEVVLRDGTAFVRSVRSIWSGLTADKRKGVLGYSPDLDAVLVGELAVLRDLNARYDALAQAAGSSQAERRARAKDAFGRGVQARQQVHQTMRDYLGEAHPVMEGLLKVMKPADDAATLAGGLTALADALARLRHGEDGHGPDAELVEDLDFAGLTDAVVASLRKLAAEVRDSDALADARPKDLAAAQRALDLQDGRVLHVVGVVLRAFRRARRADASVLAPELGDLARVFGAGGGRDAADDEPAPQPQPPAPPQPA